MSRDIRSYDNLPRLIRRSHQVAVEEARSLARQRNNPSNPSNPNNRHDTTWCIYNRNNRNNPIYIHHQEH